MQENGSPTNNSGSDDDFDPMKQENNKSKGKIRKITESNADRQRRHREKLRNEKQTHASSQDSTNQEEIRRSVQTDANRQRRHRERLRNENQRHASSQELVLPLKDYLGPMVKECPFCSGLTFPGADFNCCQNGKVNLPPNRDAPVPLFNLLTSNDVLARNFRKKQIKNTNCAFAFASLQYNKRPVGPGGVQSQKVQGGVFHLPSALYPRDPNKKAFANYYVNDAVDAAKQRQFGSLRGQLNDQTVEELSLMFEQHNELAKHYKWMHKICENYENHGENLKYMNMRLVDRFELTEKEKENLQGHPGQYHRQEDPDIISLFYDTNVEGAALPRGLVVYPYTSEECKPRAIKYFSSLCDPLCYPLLYPYGEIGWAHKGYPLRSTEDAIEAVNQREEIRMGEPMDQSTVDFEVDEGEENESDEEENEDQDEMLRVPRRDGREIGDENLDESFHSEDGENQIFDLPFRNFVFIETQGEIRPVRLRDPTENEEAELLYRRFEDELLPDEEPVSELVESTVVREESDDGLEEEYQRILRGNTQTEQEENEMSVDGEENVGEDENAQEVAVTDEDVQMETDDAEPNVETRERGNESGIPLVRRNPFIRRKKRKLLHHGALKYASMRQFYLYRYHHRPGEKYHKYFSTRKLGQLHVIDVFTRIMDQRFEGIRRAYTHDMRTTKSKLFAAMARQAQRRKRTLGALITVPKSVPGSPRYYRAKYQDAIAIANKIGKADIFLTFTGNKDWVEIKENLPKDETGREKGFEWIDDSLLTTTVFNEKKKKMLERVIGKRGRDGMWHGGIFGIVKAFVYAVEFQQRGMPHIHLLITLKDKLNDVEKIDRLLSAELPVIPEESHPEYAHKKRLRELVEKEGYAQLKRPDNGEKSEKNGADNGYVVAYCPQLLAEFECHINVELITSISPVKYIYKYIMKGFDRVLLEFTERISIDDGTDKGCSGLMDIAGHILHPKGVVLPPGVMEALETDARDILREAGIDPIDRVTGEKTLVYAEDLFIKEMRASTAVEAAWHIAGHETAVSSHTVVTMPIHLPNEEVIYFNCGEEAETARKLEEDDPQTKMKAYFQLCETDEQARQYTYEEIGEHYIFEKGAWRERKRSTRTSICRIPPVMPRYLERFALRLLAKDVKGARSFNDYKLVEGVESETFTDAAKRRGLMNDEREWYQAMNEAKEERMPNMMRRLFATILVFGTVRDPLDLWNTFKEEMYERAEKWSTEKKEARALCHIQHILERNGVEITTFNLPIYNEALIGDDDVNEDGWFHTTEEESGRLAEKMKMSMNEEQRNALERILKACENPNSSKCFFVDGPGGSGKTFMYTALYHKLRSENKTVANVAHTGIAATLLVQGSTVHRTFGIPLELQEDVQSTITFESVQASYLRHLDVIIWDEGTMSDRRIFECVDRLLKALTGKNEIFGGKIVVAGGDWKQILPIVEGVHNEGVCEYTLKASILWKQFEVLYLKTNMRTVDDEAYGKLLLNMGNGVNLEEKMIQMPSEILLPSEDAVIDWVYGNVKLEDTQTVKGRCILSLDNVTAREVNEKVLERLNAPETVYLSVDEMEEVNGFISIPTETYHQLNPPGMAAHVLKLKVGAVVILLRNLDVHLGLCNGTRLRIADCKQDVIICETLKTEECPISHKVAIPRIPMTTNHQERAEFSFIRTQFPLKLAYALTVNKSQGQTFEKIGIIFRTPAFTHGQLYVAFSRIRSLKNVKISHYGNFERDKKNKPKVMLQNIVYQQILK